MALIHRQDISLNAKANERSALLNGLPQLYEELSRWWSCRWRQRPRRQQQASGGQALAEECAKAPACQLAAKGQLRFR